MTVKQKITGITPDGGVVVESTLEEAEPPFTGTIEVWDSANHTVPALLPLVGGWVRYQVRRGRSIPMLVTDVYSSDLIDGVAFSAKPSDVGNSYGSRGFQRVKRGEGDGEWDNR